MAKPEDKDVKGADDTPVAPPTPTPPADAPKAKAAKEEDKEEDDFGFIYVKLRDQSSNWGLGSFHICNKQVKRFRKTDAVLNGIHNKSLVEVDKAEFTAYEALPPEEK